MKKSKKKKKEIISTEIRKKIRENMYRYGMNAYNAAVSAGLSHQAAEALQNKETLRVVFRNGLDDIAQRNHASLYSRMKRLAEKAGLKEDLGIQGCKTVRGSGDNFVEIDDNPAQIECIKEINRMTRTTSNAGDPEEGDTDKSINIRIVLTKDEGTKPLEKNFMGIESNPTRSNTGGY